LFYVLALLRSSIRRFFELFIVHLNETVITEHLAFSKHSDHSVPLMHRVLSQTSLVGAKGDFFVDNASLAPLCCSALKKLSYSLMIS
jgi:hypothetical protein